MALTAMDIDTTLEVLAVLKERYHIESDHYADISQTQHYVRAHRDDLTED